MLTWILLVSSAVADLPPSAARPVDFARDIRPIFQQACLKCHGPEKQKSGFRLDVKAAALKGGDNDAPGDRPGKERRQPPDPVRRGHRSRHARCRRRASPSPRSRSACCARGSIRARCGPTARARTIEDPAKTHWAFQPVKRPTVPTIRGPRPAIRNPIDAFIAAKLARSGLAMSPEADRRTLIRRLYFVLHGLPPTPEEVDAFVADERPGRLRASWSTGCSPRRATASAGRGTGSTSSRFAETHGFEMNTPRAERLAVSRLRHPRLQRRQAVRPSSSASSSPATPTGEDAATGFLVAGPRCCPGRPAATSSPSGSARQDELDDMVAQRRRDVPRPDRRTAPAATTTSSTRSPQRDYYAMQAVFAGVQHGERPLRTPDDEARQRAAERLRPQLAEIEAQLARFEPLADPVVDRADAPGGEPAIERRPLRAGRRRSGCASPSSRPNSARAVPRRAGGLHDRPAAAQRRAGRRGREGDGVGHATRRSRHPPARAPQRRPVRQRPQLDLQRDRAGLGRDRVPASRDDRPRRLGPRPRGEVQRPAGDELPDRGRRRVRRSGRLVASSDDRRAVRAGRSRRSPDSTAGSTPTRRRRSTPARREEALDARIEELTARADGLRRHASRTPDATFRLHRGDPMQPREAVAPGALARLGAELDLPADAPEQERRAGAGASGSPTRRTR